MSFKIELQDQSITKSCEAEFWKNDWSNKFKYFTT